MSRFLLFFILSHVKDEQTESEYVHTLCIFYIEVIFKLEAVPRMGVLTLLCKWLRTQDPWGKV